MRCHHLAVLSVLAAAPLVNFATPLAPPWDDIRVKHTWNAVPPNWESLGHPPIGTTIDLHVALKPHHENTLIDALYEVSDPRSPRYGAHLSREQVDQLVAPHPETVELINSWLEHHGIPPSSITTTQGGSWLKLTDVPVSQANKLLGASYQLYRPTGTNDTSILRTIDYALPAVLHTHVQTVVPTTYFAATRTPWETPRRRSVGETAGLASREPATVLSSRDDGLIRPSDLRWLYRTSTYVPAATDKNVLAIMGQLDDYPSPLDLMTFMTRCRTDAVDATFAVVQINGGPRGFDPTRNDPNGEADITMQYAQSMAYPTPHVFYSVGGESLYVRSSKQPAPGDPWLEFLLYTIGQPKVPQTIGIPYGYRERIAPLEYATTLCNMFARLGARGASVIFASGESGVGKGDCMVKSDDGSEKVQFSPEFPSSCPWITSVGGTTGLETEFAAGLSGGGFSNHFPRPAYQDNAVPAFLLNLGDKYDGLYNPAGRGIPDISAQALNLLIIKNEDAFSADGTSCSVTTVAGIISLLNDDLLSRGRAPLGFLNPWLYGLGRVGVKDITSGTNPGCGTDGFSAIAGWDPVTGLGTPDFLKLLDRVDFAATSTISSTSVRATSNSAIPLTSLTSA